MTQFRIIKPTGILSTAVDYFWIAEAPGNRSVFREIVYPQTCQQMMFYYGDRFRIRNADREPELLPRSYFCGLSTEYSELESSGGFGVIGIVFHAGAAIRIFGFPADEITGAHLPACDWPGKAGEELEEKIFLARDTTTRIALLESFLLGRLREPTPDDRRISTVLKLIQASPANFGGGRLAEKACLSERQFLRVFTRQVGLSPKQYHRIVRLNFAISLMKHVSSGDLTTLALDAGYYDQAHFNSEFRQMTGFTPGKFFRQYASVPDENIL